MKTYKVAKGTVGRLVHVTLNSERPYALSEDKQFSGDDVVFSPTSLWEQHKRRTREFGFKTGTPVQREKFVWVCESKFIIEEDDEPADY